MTDVVRSDPRPAFMSWRGRNYSLALYEDDPSGFDLAVVPRRWEHMSPAYRERLAGYSFSLSDRERFMSDAFVDWLDLMCGWMAEQDEIELQSALDLLEEQRPRQYAALALYQSGVPVHRIAVLLDTSEGAVVKQGAIGSPRADGHAAAVETLEGL